MRRHKQFLERWLAWYLFSLVIAGFTLSYVSNASPVEGQLQQFDSIWEPSAVQQMPDGRLIMLGDEKQHSISVASIEEKGSLSEALLGRGLVNDWIIGKPVLGKIEDLEGVAVDAGGYIYAITSHSRSIKGKLDKGREKLVRFQVNGEQIVNPIVKSKLKKKILKKHKALATAASVSKPQRGSGLDIEGLSFDKHKEKLLIGLRSPLIDDKALIAVLENPNGVFTLNEKIQISDKLIYLDLDKGGIRSIIFDPKLDGYLIISRRENKKGKAFKLWLWSGDPNQTPRRIRTPSSINLDHAEGVTPIRFNGKERVLFVFDNGNTLRQKAGHYLLLAYDQLIIDDA